MYRSPALPVLYLSVFFLALNGLFAKTIPLDAVSITQLRSVVAAITLGLLLVLQKRSLGVNGRIQTLKVYVLGVVMGLHWITFFHSMQVSSVAIGIISLFSYPIITVLMEPFFLKSRPKRVDLIAAIMVLLGVLVMVVEDKAGGGDVAVGVFWGCVSAFLFSLRNTTQKYLFSKVPSVPLMMHQVVAVAAVLVVFADWPRIVVMPVYGWGLLLAQGVVCTAGAHTLLVLSLKLLPAKTVALISCLQPLFAAALAWWLLGEEPGVYIMLGGGLILVVAFFESVRSVKGAASNDNIASNIH